MHKSNKSLPYVSIIVPVYNGEKIIAECIEPLLNQDYPKEKYEIIIVDNNSKDKTAEIIKKYPVRYILEDKNQSSYAARNTGIKNAKGEILAFTDSDCVAYKNWLINLIEGWESEEMGFAGELEEPTPRTVIEKYGTGLYNQKRCLSNADHPYAITGNIAFKKLIFGLIGTFNENFTSGGDSDFSWRIFKAGYKIKYNSEAKVLHKHKTTLIAQLKQAERLAFGVVCLSTTYPHMVKVYEKPLSRLIRHFLHEVVRLTYRIFTFPLKNDKKYYLTEPLISLTHKYSRYLGTLTGLEYISKNSKKNIPFE